MSGRTVKVLVVVGLALVALFAIKPELRARLASFVGGVKEEFSPGEGTRTIGGSVKVYIPRGDQFYHTRDCPRTRGKSAVPTPLGNAREYCAPCPECNPPR